MDQLRCDKCGRFLSEDDALEMRVSPTLGNPDGESDTYWCPRCVHEDSKPEGLTWKEYMDRQTSYAMQFPQYIGNMI
jgi:hypothetical protein